MRHGTCESRHGFSAWSSPLSQWKEYVFKFSTIFGLSLLIVDLKLECPKAYHVIFTGTLRSIYSPFPWPKEVLGFVLA